MQKLNINQKQLANRWGMSERTLERWRCIGWGPCFMKLGGRVVYRTQDILDFEESRLMTSTSKASII